MLSSVIWLFAAILLFCSFVIVSCLIAGKKINYSLFIQSLAAVCLLASFGGFYVTITRDIPFAVYVIDVSTSYSALKLNALETVRAHSSTLQPEASVAFIVFDTTANVYEPVNVKNFKPDTEITNRAGDGSTNLESALQAISFFNKRAERAYVFSDGWSSSGDTENGMLQCSQSEIKLFPVMLDHPVSEDTWLGEFKVPSKANINEPVKIQLSVGSNVKGKVRISLTVEQTVIHKTIDIVYPGKDVKFQYVHRFSESGIKKLDALIVPEGYNDRFPSNNSRRCSLRIMGHPQLIVCSEQKSNILEKIQDVAEHFKIESIEPGKMPQSLDLLRDTACIVVDNVAANAFSETQMTVIEKYVRDLGGGLIFLGGHSSFGPGGYVNTPLERVSPVWANPERRKHISLVILLDASGSMQQKTQFMGERIAKFQAALRSINPIYKKLDNKDSIAIISFNTEPTIEYPLTLVEDGRSIKEALNEKLIRKEPTGKTDIYPALEEAYKILENENNEEKILHIVLLSDGEQTIENQIDLQQFVNAGISISTVATGNIPDEKRLRKIAEETAGRYYEVKDFDLALRDVFVKIITGLPKLTRENIIEVTKNENVDFLDGIEAFPKLKGIVLTSKKDEAQVSAISDSGEPVIAWWRYGLGEAFVFTGSFDNNWCQEWIEWKDCRKFLMQILRRFSREPMDSRYNLSVSVSGQNVNATLEVKDKGVYINALKNLRAVFSCDNNQKMDLVLMQTAPGRYEAEVEVLPGTFCVVSVYNATNQVLETAETWVPVQAESQATSYNTNVLKQMAFLTGGAILSEDDFIKDIPGGKGGSIYELWWLLLLLTGLFYMFDIIHGSMFSSKKLK